MDRKTAIALALAMSNRCRDTAWDVRSESVLPEHIAEALGVTDTVVVDP